MDDSEVKKLLKEAKLLLEKNDIQQGVKIIKKVIKYKPETYWAYILYGFAAIKSDRCCEALKSFHRGTLINSDKVDAWKGIISCSEKFSPSDEDKNIILKAYSVLLKLEEDVDKWNELYKKAEKLFPNDIVSILSGCLEHDILPDNFKYKLACSTISLQVLEKYSNIPYTEKKLIQCAFFGYANTLDFYDRPIFCSKASSFMVKIGDYDGVSNFLLKTLMQYGIKLYSKRFLFEVLVEIAFNDMNKVEEIVPLVSEVLKQSFEGDKYLIPKLNTAMSIIYLFENDYMKARELLETGSYSGDTLSSVLLLKMLMKLMDFDGVLFLVLRLTKAFSQVNNEKLRFEFLLCLIKTLASSNHKTFLELSLKLSSKSTKIFGMHPELLYSMTYACVGLKSKKAYYYLDKLSKLPNMEKETEFLKYLIKFQSDIDNSGYKSTLSTLHSASMKILSGKLKQVVSICMQISNEDKSISLPYTLLGLYYENKNHLKKALNCYDVALFKKPYDATSLWLFCNLLLKLGEEEEAVVFLETVCSGLFSKWHSTAEKACKAAGSIRFLRNEYKKALLNFRHARKLNIHAKDCIELIADLYVQMRMLGSAENSYLLLDTKDLHIMLSLTFLMKLHNNYAGYFNNTIKCLNWLPSPNANKTVYENIVSLLFCNFVHLKKSLNCPPKSYIDNSVTKIYLEEFKKLNMLYENYNTNVPHNVEYLIAIYFFLESHYFAAIKYEKRRKFFEACKMLQFCINGISKTFKVYGSNHISFWKLLGDVFITSSALNMPIEVPVWLYKPEDKKTENFKVLSLKERLFFALRCYTVGLKKVQEVSPLRVHEFHYDLAITFIKLANHPENISPLMKYRYLKCALQSIIDSFIHYDNSENLWIHFNVMGVITSMMGYKADLFNGPFSNYTMDMKEDIIINNKATHCLKIGQDKEALSRFEQGRLMGDTCYSSPLIGQLLILISRDSEDIKKRLMFQLKFHGDHPLLKWLCAFYLLQGKQKGSLEYSNAERNIINHVFDKLVGKCDTNHSRLTILGYVYEILDNVKEARLCYLKALRVARNCSSESFDILLKNAVRLSRCDESRDLIEMISNPKTRTACLALIKSRHLERHNFNKNLFCSTLLNIHSSLDSSGSTEIVSFVHLIGPLVATSLYSLPEGSILEVPILLEVVLKNLLVTSRYNNKVLRRIITSQSAQKMKCIITHLENYLFTHQLKNVNPSKIHWVVPEDHLSNTLESILCSEEVSFTGSESEYNIVFSMDSKLDSVQYVDSHPPEVQVEEINVQKLAVPHWCSYGNTLLELRASLFPLPLSFHERLALNMKLVDERSKTSEEQEHNGIGLLSPPDLANVPPVAQINRTKFKTAPNSKKILESHRCHNACKNVVALFYKHFKSKDYELAAKYCMLCLGIRCFKCINIKGIIPVISFISYKLKNIKLLQKILHLYPDETILLKTLKLICASQS